MIFGRTRAEREALKRKRKEWHPHFAWRPRRLEDGRWAWLEDVERRDRPPHHYYGSDIFWEYRLPE